MMEGRFGTMLSKLETMVLFRFFNLTNRAMRDDR